MKKILSVMLAVLVLLSTALFPVSAANTAFPDVHDTDWFADYVAYAAGHHIMNGDGTNFNPNDCTTREEFAQIMYNIFATDEEKAMAKAGEYKNKFTDVKEGFWYVPAVTWANAKHIVSGYGGGIFGIGDYVTREDACVMLWRAGSNEHYHYIDDNFNDVVDIDDYAMYAMLWCIHVHIISGDNNGYLNPRDTATRAEIAKIMSVYYRDIFLQDEENKTPSEETTVPTDAPTQEPTDETEEPVETEAPTTEEPEETTEEETTEEETTEEDLPYNIPKMNPDLEYIPMEFPTINKNGHVGYWKNTKTGKCYDDPNGIKPIKEFITIINIDDDDEEPVIVTAPNGHRMFYFEGCNPNGLGGIREHWIDMDSPDPDNPDRYFAENHSGLSYQNANILDENNRWIKASKEELTILRAQKPLIAENKDGSKTYVFEPVTDYGYVPNIDGRVGSLHFNNPTNYRPWNQETDTFDWTHGHYVRSASSCSDKYADGCTLVCEEWEDHAIVHVIYKGEVKTYNVGPDEMPDHHSIRLDLLQKYHADIEAANGDDSHNNGYADNGVTWIIDKRLVIVQYSDGTYKVIE